MRQRNALEFLRHLLVFTFCNSECLWGKFWIGILWILLQSPKLLHVVFVLYLHQQMHAEMDYESHTQKCTGREPWFGVRPAG